MTLPGRFRAVVFDLDGLVVQTERLWSLAKERLFERHGVRFERADHLAVFGTSDHYTARVFAQRLGLPPAREDEVRREYLAIASGLFRAGVPVSDGARDLIDALRGRVPVGLATNTRREQVGDILRAAGLVDAFDAVVTGDDGTAKPAPDIYALACVRLGVAPAEAVALEDSPTGVAAARAAGLTVIGVPSAAEVPLAEAHVVVASLRDLLPAGQPAGSAP
jgi:HAD superfamily hydrolase (TIGR01509 family)